MAHNYNNIKNTGDMRLAIKQNIITPAIRAYSNI